MQPTGVGFINLVITASVDGCNEKLVFRIYKKPFYEHLDKKEETKATLVLNELGISPRVLCMFTNGFCFEFVEGKNFNWDDAPVFDDLGISK